MPSQQEVKWSQLKVGVLVFVAICILTGLVFLMSGSMGSIFSRKLVVRSYFENAAGIKVGAPVNLEGVAIGAVSKIRVITAPDRKLTPVEVTMKISGDYAKGIYKDSRASLETVGVLGDTVVDIASHSAKGALAHENDELPTNETPSLADVIKASQGTIDQVNTILAKVNTIADSLNSSKGSIGLLINTPDLYNRANDVVGQLQKLIDDIANGKGSVGKLIASDELYDRLNSIAAKLEDVSKQIDSGEGTAGKLIKDPALYNNANDTLAKANALINDINNGKGAIGMLAKDPQFQAKLNDTVSKLDSILARADNGEGTLGQLVRNPSLYNNADQMLNESRGLITAIREDPKKYLTFHVKVF